MKIELGKQYRTRDGRDVRIYAVDGYGHYPVHGAYNVGSNNWEACCWTKTGCANHREFIPVIDLIEVKPRIQRRVWVNVYPYRMGVPHGNKAYVDAHRGKDCIACVEIDIDVEEGHGL